MKVLLYLNGAEGFQTGIEDGFNYLKESKEIDELKWFYYQDYERKNGHKNTIEAILKLAGDFQPDYIIFFHLGPFKIDKKTLEILKNLSSKPVLVYDEGDMYGGIAKPFKRHLKTIIEAADVVSLRGTGVISQRVSKFNRNIIYTPHHADIARFDKAPFILEERIYPAVLIGNKVQSRVFKRFLSIPGAIEREKTIKYVSTHFPDKFHLFGSGWSGIKTHKGSVDFQKQIDVYRNSWLTIAYEHYPEVADYFSNRLPIALLAGSLYVCHYHKGYENLFKDCDFMFFYKTKEELSEVLKYIFSLSKEDLLERSKRARAFAKANYIPEVVWGKFFSNIQKQQSLS